MTIFLHTVFTFYSSAVLSVVLSPLSIFW